MKNNKKICLLLMTLILITTGCTYEREYVQVDENTQVMRPDENNVLQTQQILDIPGEDFKLVCDYDTGKYDINNWRVTDSKIVGMKVNTQGLPEGYEVFIDHVHADISLKAVTPQIDGITQDSMDDTCHALSQDGFFINDNDFYYNIFGIEGYTDQFYQLWGYACGEYGYVSSEYKRLTEKNIVSIGTYAQKLSVVYDLSIKAPDDEFYHTVSVSSEILIPVNRDTSQMTETVDIMTGQVIED